MNLVKFNTHRPAYRSFPSLFNGFFPELDLDLTDRDVHSVPATNILAEETNYKIEVSLPGYNKADIKVDLKEDVLSISTEHKVEKEEDQKTFSKREFGFRAHKRSFTLPEDVDRDNIKAEYKNGVLYIEIPRMKEEKVETHKQITIS